MIIHKSSLETKRRLPIGAELIAVGVHFRVWAPDAKEVEAVFESGSNREPLVLKAEGDGYFAGVAPTVGPGERYRFRLSNSSQLLPDPVSRFQPEGPFGPSEIIDPLSFVWTDDDWSGLGIQGQVVYEMHVGTFTQEGTWAAAARELQELAEIGITLLELMPVAEFSGNFGWSYDGVNLFAPTRFYGRPDDLRRFVNEAHRLGIGVVLDVMYNHAAPVGNFLGQFAEEYLSRRHKSEWGAALNFDGPGSRHVREFVLANARYWIQEFHVDGYRIDATQAMDDDSPVHILAELTGEIRRAGGRRKMIVLGENEPQDSVLLRPLEEGGHGMDAVWNDDFHHSAMVRLTGRNEAYYSDHLGSAEEFVAGVEWGYLFQGQRYRWQGKPRGTPVLDVAPQRFINYLQNHDQLANSMRGTRIHALTSPGRYRAMTALLLLAPQTPLLFQGQEFGSSSPFLYFNDGSADAAELVARGRAKFLSQFPSYALEEVRSRLPRPDDPATFQKCKLDFTEREKHAEIYQLHRDLLCLRRNDPVLNTRNAGRIAAATIGADALLLRWIAKTGDDRLLLVNFGRDLHYEPAPQPLLAPPRNRAWQMLWSSENPTYGGTGTPAVDTPQGWKLPGEAAVLLCSGAKVDD